MMLPCLTSSKCVGPVTAKLCVLATLNNSRILFKVYVQESRKSGLFQIAFPSC